MCPQIGEFSLVCLQLSPLLLRACMNVQILIHVRDALSFFSVLFLLCSVDFRQYGPGRPTVTDNLVITKT